jgi:hypothetical protein
VQRQAALSLQCQCLDEDSLPVGALCRYGQGPVAAEFDPEVVAPPGVGADRRGSVSVTGATRTAGSGWLWVLAAPRWGWSSRAK